MGELAQGIAAHPWPWVALVALGVYHGVNPAMGWLFAVGNGLQAGRARAVFTALPPITAGHFLAVAVALLPFALLSVYVDGLNQIRAACGVILIAFGGYKLVARRHPRFLARIGPKHLALWSFMMATAHGAGLMLVPIWLMPGMVSDEPHSTHARSLRLGHELGSALAAVAVHTLATVLTAALIAWLVYHYFGLKLLRRAWFNFDLLWAVILIVTGGIALAVSGV